MQAVLLCEYFARFRGRKAVTRPSSTFIDLYSRVSSPRFLASSFRLGGPFSPPEIGSGWSPVSSSPLSFSSDESDCRTPTPSSPSPHPGGLGYLNISSSSAWACNLLPNSAKYIPSSYKSPWTLALMSQGLNPSETSPDMTLSIRSSGSFRPHTSIALRIVFWVYFTPLEAS